MVDRFSKRSCPEARPAKIFALLGRRCPCSQRLLTRDAGNHRKERAGRCGPMKFGICGPSCATRLSSAVVLKECTSQRQPRTTEHRTPRFEWPSDDRPLAARGGRWLLIAVRRKLPLNRPYRHCREPLELGCRIGAD